MAFPGITVIHVPDVLGGSPVRTEQFLSCVAAAPMDRPLALDLAAVSWIRPYGAVVLLGVCRHLGCATGMPVPITGLRHEIHAYLRRIDFFDRSRNAVVTTDTFDEADDWNRSDASSNVLELVAIRDASDVFEVSGRARGILDYWLSGASYDIDQIVSLLVEACANVVDHSRDVGAVMVQKYERGRGVDIDLAISDLGIGVRRSLVAVHRRLVDTPAGYIERALDGLTARPDGRGGQGLGAIRRIATASGGSVFIRSETGHLLAQTIGSAKRDGLAFFPGTQVAITFRSSAW